MKYGLTTASLLIVLAFLVVLFSHAWIYPLFNLVLLGILLLFLKQYEWKTFTTILSPILVVPLALYSVDIFDRILPTHSSNIWFYGFILAVTLIYAYLFRDALTRWIEPKNHKTFLCLVLTIFASSFIASLIAIYCLDISSSEKGVSPVDVRACQLVGAYLPSISGKSFGWPYALQIVSFFPSAFVLLSMLVRHFKKQPKSE
ncbi:hypothetical protein KBB27_01805 [Patescibacteria group bacterium]|nr:hypothetical protein [Patescibacteria group bacterium]